MSVVCPKCGESAVEFEDVEGVSACAACGWVVADEELVHAASWDDKGMRQGMFVGAEDTGEHAAAHGLQSSGTGLAIQRSKGGGGEAKLKARVRELAALLHLQPPIVDQALHVAGLSVPHCLGNWRRDHLAAAATYAACRLNKLALTLADLSGVIQVDVHTLGHYYCTLCRLLDLQPPQVMPADLLPRSVDRATAAAVAGGTLAATTVAAVRRDAEMLLDWMHNQLNQRQFPLGCVGAALVLAAEMNTVSLSLDHVSSSLPLCRSTLDRKLYQTKQRLMQLSAFLPYSSAITARNVGSHARTIIKLSALVGSTKPADASTSNGANAGLLAGPTHSNALQPARSEQAQPEAQLPQGVQLGGPLRRIEQASQSQPQQARQQQAQQQAEQEAHPEEQQGMPQAASEQEAQPPQQQGVQQVASELVQPEGARRRRSRLGQPRAVSEARATEEQHTSRTQDGQRTSHKKARI